MNQVLILHRRDNVQSPRQSRRAGNRIGATTDGVGGYRITTDAPLPGGPIACPGSKQAVARGWADELGGATWAGRAPPSRDERSLRAVALAGHLVGQRLGAVDLA